MFKNRIEYSFKESELKKNIPVGLSIPFNAPGIFKINYSTKEQVKVNLINLLLTSRGERVFNPSFGGNLRNFLFEQDSSIDVLEETLIEQIKVNIPQAKDIKVSLDKNSDINTIYIKIEYFINGEKDNAIIEIT